MYVSLASLASESNYGSIVVGNGSDLSSLLRFNRRSELDTVRAMLDSLFPFFCFYCPLLPLVSVTGIINLINENFMLDISLIQLKAV